MRLLISFFFFLLINIQIAFSQTEQDDINLVFAEYFSAMRKNDTENQLKFIYPKFLDLFPRDSIKLYLSQQQEDSSIYINYILEISPIKRIDSIQYAVIRYPICLKMDFSDIKDEHGASLAISAGLSLLKDKYGAENVKFDKNLLIITAIIKEEMYAIKDSKNGDWKFLDKKIKKEILKMILPESML